MWSQRPGRQGRLGGYRQPDTLPAWDDYTVHRTDASTKAAEESDTSLFLIPGGLTPKLQSCGDLVNKIFKANMSRLYDDHMTSKDVVTCNEHGYSEAPLRGSVAPRVKRSWDAWIADEIRWSWRKAGLLLPFDGSEDEAWVNKELDSNAQGEPIDALSADADKTDSSSGGENLLDVLEIDDDDDTGEVVVGVSDDEGEELGGIGSDAGVEKMACGVLLMFTRISPGVRFSSSRCLFSLPHGVQRYCVSYCRFVV